MGTQTVGKEQLGGEAQPGRKGTGQLQNRVWIKEPLPNRRWQDEPLPNRRWQEEPLPGFLSPRLLEAGAKHLFTTRDGGVSEGIFESLNFSFSRGDDPERVRENYRRTAAAFGLLPDRIVCTDQTHTANIRIVTEADAGKGVTRPRDYTDTDGLVTDVPDLILGVFVADCVPVLLYDPVHKAAGAVHSGWRGTVQRIGQHAVRMMSERYGTDPKELICAIGPSICGECYEVSEDVAQRFADLFGEEAAGDQPAAERTGEEAGNQPPVVRYKGIREGERKYLVDLWEANRRILTETGVDPGHIDVLGVCTCCNPALLFSHRASRGKRGNLGAFITAG